MTTRFPKLARYLSLPLFFAACTPDKPSVSAVAERLIGSPVDPGPTLSFTQQALAVGLNRANEPASLLACNPGGAANLMYGTFAADFNGDGIMDVLGVSHGMACHQSGLWLGDGAGGFGQNIWTGAFAAAPRNGISLGLLAGVTQVADFTGDGRPDVYFFSWNGLGGLCVNQGNSTRSDWSGPTFLCYAAWASQRFGDVNGDGRLDVETLDMASGPYDWYRDFTHDYPRTWKINNGTDNISTWASASDYFSFVGKAAPDSLLDINKDGLPDKIQGVQLPPAQRGSSGTSSGGLRVWLGQVGGTYAQVSSGLENVVESARWIEDFDGDGCLDVGLDASVYRGNATVWRQVKTAGACTATFVLAPSGSLGYDVGADRQEADLDNDGLKDRISIVHVGNYGPPPGVAAGVHVYRKLSGGGYQALGALGINIFGTFSSEFYADAIAPADWNGDGRIDLPAVGSSSIAGTDAGTALWTSTTTTTNRWVRLNTPTISGFFVGPATIELFDAGFVGDPAHLASEALILRTGQTWASKTHNFGVGTRGTVDVRVTFPDGGQTVQAGVSTNATITITPVANLPPIAVIAAPSSAAIGAELSFDGAGSSDPDGTIARYDWTLGDGATATGPTASHAYSAAGTFTTRLTVTDNSGSSTVATTTVAVADVTPPTAAITSVTFTPTVSDDSSVASVIWSLDGVQQAQPMTAPFSYTLNLAPLASGQHVVSCRALDPSGNPSPNALLTITK